MKAALKASIQRVFTARMLRWQGVLLAAVQMLCTYHCHELHAGRLKSSHVTKRCPIGKTESQAAVLGRRNASYQVSDASFEVKMLHLKLS